MFEQRPSVGRIVIFHGPTHRFEHFPEEHEFRAVPDYEKQKIWQRQNNGAIVCPAIITRVWSDTSVNVTLFRDGNEPTSRTSVNILKPGSEPTTNDLCTGYVTWPERV